MIERNCLFCHKDFQAPLSEYRRGGAQYCSPFCWYEKRREDSRQTLELRFWASVNKHGSLHPYDATLGSCWMWTAGLWGGGYGRFRVAGKQKNAHIVAFELMYGPVPDDMKILHTCDRPACCRHLYAGTLTDNMRDCIERNRRNAPLGEARWGAKLTENQVREIYRQKGMQSCRKVGIQYGVCHKTIRAIWNKKKWKHVVNLLS